MQEGDDFRRNRDKYVLEIRKNNREDLITKSRKRLVDKTGKFDPTNTPIVIDERYK